MGAKEDREEALRRLHDAENARDEFDREISAQRRDWTQEERDEYDRLSKNVTNALYYI